MTLLMGRGARGGMACISCGTLLCQTCPYLAWLSSKASQDTQAMALLVVLKRIICHRLQPSFLLKPLCTACVCVLGLSSPLFLFPDVCSFVQYWSDPALVVAYSTGFRFVSVNKEVCFISYKTRLSLGFSKLRDGFYCDAVNRPCRTALVPSSQPVCYIWFYYDYLYSI